MNTQLHRIVLRHERIVGSLWTVEYRSADMVWRRWAAFPSRSTARWVAGNLRKNRTDLTRGKQRQTRIRQYWRMEP